MACIGRNGPNYSLLNTVEQRRICLGQRRVVNHSNVITCADNEQNLITPR